MFGRYEQEMYEAVRKVMQEDTMPIIKEIISNEVAKGIEKLYAEKQTRMESITKYLGLLYEAQRSGHSVHEEITQALQQYKQEAGI